MPRNITECAKCSGSGRNHLDSSDLSIEEVINSQYACEECGGLGQVEEKYVEVPEDWNEEPAKGYWYIDKDGNAAHSFDFEEAIGE